MKTENELMTRAAWLYYIAGLTQKATSQQMGITRARVNKLLAQARETGVVSFAINERDVGLLSEETLIRSEYNLEFCLITPILGLTASDTEVESNIAFSMVGAAAAQYLREQLSLKPDLIVGTGWGRTLDYLSRSLSGVIASNAKFFSLMGSLTSNSSFNPFEVVHTIARATGGEGYFLPAPFIADSEEDREVFLSQRGISETLALAKRANLAFISVGELTEQSLLRKQNMITKDQVTELRALGVIGDTNGIFFDKHGTPVDHELNRRTIAIDLHLLSLMKTIVLSAGRSKLNATNGILRSGAIKGLIIDGDSAMELCKSIRSNIDPHI